MLLLKNIKEKDFLIVLFSLFPIAILVGNFAINLFILLIANIFFLTFYNKKIDYIKYKISFYLLLFFLTSLIVNLFFTNDLSLSYTRVLKFFFVVLFIIAFKFLIIEHYSSLTKIYKYWVITFLAVFFDLLFEFYYGKNILGLTSVFPGRLASFTGKESVIGNFFFGFSLIFLTYAYEKYKKINLNMILAIILITISFLIGERSNFIRTFISIIFFIFLAYEVKFKYKFVSLALVLIILFVIFNNLNEGYKIRYYGTLKLLFEKDGVSKYLADSNYGAHRNVAKEIFKDNPFFGIGIKNFRNESGNKKYDNLDHSHNLARTANHPHEIYYEFLSETGIFGFISFVIFFLISIIISVKNYLNYKNLYQLSGIIFIIVSLFPVLPSGSFLSTYTSSIFWLNYALMMGYNLKK